MTDIFERYPEAGRALDENRDGFADTFSFVGSRRATAHFPRRIAELIDQYSGLSSLQKEAMMVGAFFALGGNARGCDIADRYSPSAGTVLDLLHAFPDTPAPGRISATIDAAIKLTMLEEVERFSKSLGGLFDARAVFDGKGMQKLRHRLFNDMEKIRTPLEGTEIGALFRQKCDAVMNILGRDDRPAVTRSSFPSPELN